MTPTVVTIHCHLQLVTEPGAAVGCFRALVGDGFAVAVEHLAGAPACQHHEVLLLAAVG